MIGATSFILLVLGGVLVPAKSEETVEDIPDADTALVLAIDVSNSVNLENYRLQMDGIARALEDPEVIRTIAGGPHGGIYLSVVTWSSQSTLLVPWTKLTSKSDAQDIGRILRTLPRNWTGGEATCVGQLLERLAETLVPEIRGKALRTVIDVSGDGEDNCSPPGGVAAARDMLVARGVTINGLPILQGGDSNDHATVAGWRLNKGQQALVGEELKVWYEKNVRGGPSSFVLAAEGFSDFARAFRTKFIVEISGLLPPVKPRQANRLAAAGR